MLNVSAVKMTLLMSNSTGELLYALRPMGVTMRADENGMERKTDSLTGITEPDLPRPQSA